ncbi:hypothetical protein [Paraburkholderia phenazinium]|uniref:Phage terminase small subunit n=1 Tax=Paraburkholderia phenazinium TaxID=60549 RepID=A0A1N6KP92_9BURK|nr:hypothetical protein [Paraburkholderia phenazinium]SIO58358.1 hypothetical protein SAMN05444165_4115 [Paraburkholderia phenazinium]
MSKSPEKKPDVDWERVESDYRAGILSLREIAAANPGVNHMAIARRAKREGWTQDLSAKIHAKADELVTRQAVTESVTAERAVTDRVIVEENAQAIANVRLTHRKDISKFRAIALKLLEELEAQTIDKGLFEDLGFLLRQEDDKGRDRRNDIYNAVISSAGRIDGVKKLAEVLKILIGLEREAYGIAEHTGKEDAVDNLALALEAARKRRAAVEV